MRIHTISLKGQRPKNEDVIVIKKGRDSEDNIVAGVFDGHGGRFVSDYAARKLLNHLKDKEHQNDIRREVERFHKNMVFSHPKETEDCGSTLLLARLRNNNLQIIHLGDSRAVLKEGSRVVTLTVDHKPDETGERFRITSIGQRIVFDREDRVWRVNGYSVSRALGDHSAPGISQECEVINRKLRRDSQYLILACDGVWDVISSEEACKFVDEFRASGEALETGRTKGNAAYHLARHVLNAGSMDNISIVILFF